MAVKLFTSLQALLIVLLTSVILCGTQCNYKLVYIYWLLIISHQCCIHGQHNIISNCFGSHPPWACVCVVRVHSLSLMHEEGVLVVLLLGGK